MSEYRYLLEPYKGMNTRHRCPSCQQRERTFSLYIDTETGEHIHPSVGRCNRENKCGYHYKPKEYFQDNNFSFDTPQPKAYKPLPIQPKPKQYSYIPFDVFKASLKEYNTNNFVKYLVNLFGVQTTHQLINDYFIGTSNHWNGSTVFYQIDIQGKIRAGKIMLFNASTGKRVKVPYKHISWLHKALKMQHFELLQCFFGEHQLIDKTKIVAIVESEAAAIIASAYLPQFIWLAAGGKDGLNAEKCSVLKGRTVILFPDLDGFEKWSSKAKELSHIAKFTVSTLLESKATEAAREQQFDIADYLVRLDLAAFTETKPEAVQTFVEVEQPVSWDHEITELENYFASIDIPAEPVMLNSYTKISNCSLFIQSHTATVKANNGKRTMLPYLNRLQELKNAISKF